ncbi:MAG TPA: UbiA family prenyltransferase [Chthoniobacteraceae bacterium]|nr:UbiA family prenyltransferase [Chthoniobacteraceae bacterium]
MSPLRADPRETVGRESGNVRSALPKRCVREIVWLLKVARPGFWLTSIWFYLLPLGGRVVWNTWTFWLGLFYITLPLGLLIYGWNDAGDFENDRANPRKDTFLFGARPSAAQIAALPRWIAITQIPFVFVFGFLLGAKSVGWWVALLAATAVYNAPRVGTKSWPIVDLLNQTAYLLVFVLSSWLNHVPQLPWFTFVFGVLFAIHSHLFGEIMDHEPDLAAGRRTTAGVLGMIPAKFLVASLLASEALLIWSCARDPWIAVALSLGAGFFVLDGAVLWRARPYTNRQMRFAFLGWNAVALMSIPWVWRTVTLARFASG